MGSSKYLRVYESQLGVEVLSTVGLPFLSTSDSDKGVDEKGVKRRVTDGVSTQVS